MKEFTLLQKELLKGLEANIDYVKTIISNHISEISIKEYYHLVKTALNNKCSAEIVKNLLADFQLDNSIITDVFNDELKKGVDANIEYIEILLENGVVIINNGYISANNSLQIALRNKCSADVITLLLEKGAALDNSQKGNSSIDQALFWGCDFGTIQILLQYGASATNQQEVREITETSLHLAIEHNHPLATIKILIQNNALLVTDTKNPYETTLSFALRKKLDFNILELFIRSYPDCVKDSDRKGKYCLVNQLFEIYQTNLGYNPDVNHILEFLLKSGAKPCNDIDNNSLDIALKYHASSMLREILLEHGAEVKYDLSPIEQDTVVHDRKNNQTVTDSIAKDQKSYERSSSNDYECQTISSISSCSDFRYRYSEESSLESENFGSHSI